MPTEINGYSPSEETILSSFIINEVDSNETFKKMKEKGILQDNQLYLVTDEQGGGTYYTAGEVDTLLQNKARNGTFRRSGRRNPQYGHGGKIYFGRN